MPHFLSVSLCLENHIKCIDEDVTKLTSGGKQIKQIVMLSAEYVKRHCERNNHKKLCKMEQKFAN